MIEKGILSAPVGGIIEEGGTTVSFLFRRWFDDLWRNYPKIQTFTKALDPGTVSAGTESVSTITVTGVTTDDSIVVNKPTNDAGLDLVTAWASASGVVSVKFRNPSGGDISPGEETYKIVATRM